MIESLLAGNSGVLVCDGATGTVLHAAGHPLDQMLPYLNVANPEVVRVVHDSYLHSGVDLIQTNTFGAGRLRLREAGLDGRTDEINRAGVRIAREAVDTVERHGAGRGLGVARGQRPPTRADPPGRAPRGTA